MLQIQQITFRPIRIPIAGLNLLGITAEADEPLETFTFA